MRIKFSVSDEDVVKVKGFAKKSQSFIKSSAKKIEAAMAEDFVQFFKKKLKSDGLGLIPLTALTVIKKRSRGNPLPKVPFYGRGATDTRSVYSLIRVYQSSGGTSAGFQGNAKHHSGLKIKELLIYHRNGIAEINLPRRDPFAEAKRRYKPDAVLRRKAREILNAEKRRSFKP
jgi:hypothetical protein